MSVADKNKGESGAASQTNGETARTRRRTAREQVILNAARLIMAETGYDAMTMDDLAARAHVSKPTLYQYFPSKESVAVRAIIGLMQQSGDYLNQLDAGLPAALRLQTFVRWVLEQRFTPFRAAFGAAKTALAPVVRSHPDYEREFARLIASISELVEQAKNENDLARELSTRVVVQIVFSLLRDTEYDLLVTSGECTQTEVVETLSALFLCGIRYCPEPKPLLFSSFAEEKRGAAFCPLSKVLLEPTG